MQLEQNAIKKQAWVEQPQPAFSALPSHQPSEITRFDAPPGSSRKSHGDYYCSRWSRLPWAPLKDGHRTFYNPALFLPFRVAGAFLLPLKRSGLPRGPILSGPFRARTYVGTGLAYFYWPFIHITHPVFDASSNHSLWFFFFISYLPTFALLLFFPLHTSTANHFQGFRHKFPGCP